MIFGTAFIIGTVAAILTGSILMWISRIALDRRLLATLDPSRVRRRHMNSRAIMKIFPDFLDLLALALSAGLTLDAAWQTAVDALPPSEFADHFRSFSRSIEWGQSRIDAFQDLAKRLPDPRLQMVIALISQSMRRGSVLHDVLIDQANMLRQSRFTEIERRAQTAGLRLLFPIFVFILPTVFLILFAPLLIKLSQGGSLF